MESYEASRAVFTRIQSIDLENASKIMGYILLHHDENDMITLSYGPETLLLSLVNKAKTHLGLSSNTSCAPLITPISNPIAISKPNPLNLSITSPRLSNVFNNSSPSSPSIWSPHHVSLSPNNASHNLSYVSNKNNSRECSNVSLLDDFQLKDSNFGAFLNDPLTLPHKNMDFIEQNLDNNNISSESSCFNDNLSYYGTDDSTSGFGFKPCLYYSRGFCKDGSSCNFVHGDNVDIPCNYDATFEQCQEEIFRSKIAHQHRLAAQLVANGVTMPFNKFSFLHSEAQRSAAALMMSEDFHKLNRVRMARNELFGLDYNPVSRQIYLTFPADSTFKEEDVSSYFNKFGPVQDVRIPYQQKRMFGFVTFVFPETVKIILAKGNPHFVCDSRVLVKPYKEKGKLPDKKHQFERGEFSCSSPSEHDCREPYDFQHGGRMMYSTQEMLIRKKLEEQAELQHALELQERRLMNLQLLNLRNKQQQHNASIDSHVPSPSMPSQVLTNSTSLSPSDGMYQDVSAENKETSTVDGVDLISEGVNGLSDSNGNVPNKEGSSLNHEEDELLGSLDHALPDNLFVSPTKSSSNIPIALSTSDIDSTQPDPSSLISTPLKSCLSETPRIIDEQGALGL